MVKHAGFSDITKIETESGIGQVVGGKEIEFD